jgi:hypothetical protein
MKLPKILKPAPCLFSAVLILYCTGPSRAQAEKAREAATNPNRSSADTSDKPPAPKKPADVGNPAETGKPLDASTQPEQPKPATPADGQPNLSASCSPNEGCRLGSALTLHFNQPPDKNTTQTLELMLDGRVMKGLTPRGPLLPDKDAKGVVLTFDLKRLPSDSPDAKANHDAWNAVLSAGYHRDLGVGVAQSGKPVDGVNSTIGFNALPSWWPLIALMMGAIVALFIALALKSDILRDGPHVPNGKRLSFSLGRTQMAWWTFIIACSFIYVWLVTQDWSFPIPSSVLVLMGISAATAMGAQLVDVNRNQRRQAMVDQQRTLSNRLDQINVALRAAPPNAADLQAERTQKQSQFDDVNSALAKLPPDSGPSENFLTDILSEDDGVSLHRFQFAVWTLILGIVFIVAVFRSLSLPDFDGTLQTLMGISAGTYVGFKIPDPPKQS